MASFASHTLLFTVRWIQDIFFIMDDLTDKGGGDHGEQMISFINLFSINLIQPPIIDVFIHENSVKKNNLNSDFEYFIFNKLFLFDGFSFTFHCAFQKIENIDSIIILPIH